MSRKLASIALIALSLAGLTACSQAPTEPVSQPVVSQAPKPVASPKPVSKPKPKPAPKPAVTPAPAPVAPVEAPAPDPVPVPEVPVAAPAPVPVQTPAPKVPDFKPNSQPKLTDPYTGEAIPFPTIPAGMHFEEDDKDAYEMWVSFRNFKKEPVGSFAEYRSEYIGTFDDWDKYAKFEEKGGYGLIPLDNGSFAAFKGKNK